MRSCAAYGCKNNDYKSTCAGKSFFSFPLRHKQVLKIWLLKIRRPDLVPNASTVLCSDHFTEDCFMYQNFTHKRFLKPGVIPTIFPYEPDLNLNESSQVINGASANHCKQRRSVSPCMPSTSDAISNLKTEDTSSASEEMETKSEPENEDKMDVDQVPSEPLQTVPASGASIDIKEKTERFVKIIPIEPGKAYLTIDDMPVEEDEQITMTAEEVRSLIEEKVFEKIVNNNPLAAMTKHSMDVLANLEVKRDEFLKLSKLVDIIERDQMKFLRKDKNLVKYLSKSSNCGVDMPILHNSVPDESYMKRGTFPQGNTLIGSIPASTKTLTPTPIPTKPAPVFTVKSAQPAIPAAAFGAKLPPAATNVTSAAPSTAAKPGADVECIDLTDDTELPVEPAKKDASSYSYLSMVKHPAPLPPKPFSAVNKDLPPIPPKPRLRITSENRGIVLQWDMIPNNNNLSYAPLKSFDIFGYQEQEKVPINTLLWKKIGNVKAMVLPMACTLTQFIEGNKYHFSIRAVDEHNRCGFYSDPISIMYTPKKD